MVFHLRELAHHFRGELEIHRALLALEADLRAERAAEVARVHQLNERVEDRILDLERELLGLDRDRLEPPADAAMEPEPNAIISLERADVKIRVEGLGAADRDRPRERGLQEAAVEGAGRGLEIHGRDELARGLGARQCQDSAIRDPHREGRRLESECTLRRAEWSDQDLGRSGGHRAI